MFRKKLDSARLFSKKNLDDVKMMFKVINLVEFSDLL
jgi:hypothetical protein